MADLQDALPRLDLGLADLAPDYDLVLCDVWGVIHNGVRRHDPAIEALRRFRAGGGTVILVTNAPVPRNHVVRRLEALGVPVEAYDGLATSGDVTIALIVAAGCPPLYGIGPAHDTFLYAEAARLGPRAPEMVEIERARLAVCIGLDETHDMPDDYDTMLRTLRARDVELVCANPDIVVEVGDDLVYCAGAIAERYEAMGGRVTHAGKPFPAIYERAMAMAAEVRGAVVPSGRVLAIGDAMRTDVRGALGQGFDVVFVTSGIHRAALQSGGRESATDPERLARFLADYSDRPLAAVPQLTWTYET